MKEGEYTKNNLLPIIVSILLTSTVFLSVFGSAKLGSVELGSHEQFGATEPDSQQVNVTFDVMNTIISMDKDTIHSKYTAIEPTLDGVVGDVEWRDAYVYEDVGDENRFTIYLMHGEDYFYIGLKLEDDTKSLDDRFFLYFDEGDDGAHGSGSGDGVLKAGQEDHKSIGGDGVLRDGWWDTFDNTSYFYYDINQPLDSINFEAAIEYHSDHWEVEFKIPFKGNDGHPQDLSDLNINIEDTPGVLFAFRDATGWRFYPEGSCFKCVSNYLELKFEAPQANIIHGIDPLLISGVIIGIMAATSLIIIFKRAKRKFI